MAYIDVYCGILTNRMTSSFWHPTQIRSAFGSAIPSTLFSKQDAGRSSRRFIGGALLPCSSGKVQILMRAHRMLVAASSGKSRIKIY